MGKLLEVWLRRLEELQTPHMQYNKTNGNYQETFEKDHYIVHAINAVNHALEFERPIPKWAVRALDADKRLQKYRPFPKDEKIEFQSMKEVMGRWGIGDHVKLARHIWNDGLGYYVISGKWMSGVAQAVRKQEITTYKGNRVHLMVNGWTWVDDGEITLDKIMENLGDFAFSMEDMIQFEKEHNLIPQKQDVQRGSEFPYVFRKTSPGWEIQFNGGAVGPVKQLGYGYFHYCIKNHPEEFTSDELEKVVNLKRNPDELNYLPMELDSEEPGIQFGNSTFTTRQDLSDQKTLQETKKWRKEQEALIARFEQEDNTVLAEKARLELEEVNNKFMTQWRGRSKTFRDETTKANERVSRAMARALDDLRTHSEEAYDHLKSAFGNIYKSTKRYRPIEKIDWILE